MNIFKQKDDGKYMGNIWGRKVSLAGGLVLGLLLSVMIYRHITLGVKPGFKETNFLHFEPIPSVTKDTLTK